MLREINMVLHPPRLQMRERQPEKLSVISKDFGLKSVTVAFNIISWQTSAMKHYSRKHFTLVKDTR
jgi:hypothetical protein